MTKKAQATKRVFYKHAQFLDNRGKPELQKIVTAALAKLAKVGQRTGVNNSPTKNTRKSETSMTLQDGEVVVMGGLSQGKQSSVTSGIRWLPAFMDGRSDSGIRSDIVLVLSVTKLQR